jgi:branched-chain amino acid transport system substrate-binding protein
MNRRIFFISLLVVLVSVVLLSLSALAEEKEVKIGIVVEISGAGAPVGKNWERAVLMAVDEINARGGILGKQIETFTLDTKSEAPVSAAVMRKAIGMNPFAIMGTIYSSSTVVNMKVLQQAGIPQFTGSEAPKITQQGNRNIFRTSYHAGLSMQKVVKWLTEVLKVRSLAFTYCNDTVGKGVHDALVELLTPKGVKIVADIATEVGQADFTGELARVQRSGADTFFIFYHEEENARILLQIREMGLDKSMKIVGHTTLLASDTLRLAKEAANGIRGHVGLSPVAPPLKALADKYENKYGELPDHNFYKAYMGTYTVKAIVEEIGAFDQQKFRDTLHNHTLCVKDHPGILMDIYYDENGDIDRESFLVEVQNQKHVITGTLPPLRPELFEKCK